MSFDKATLQRIAELTKVKFEDLEKANKDEKEVAVEIDDKITAYSEDEISTLRANEYGKGKTAATEIIVKDVKVKHNLDFTGKTIDGLVEAVQKKAVEDAKVNPDKKVTELQERVTTLQKTVSEYESKLTAKDTEVQTVKINTELSKCVPAGTSLDPDEVIVVMKSKGYDFKLEDGKLVAYKDGKVVQDKVANAVPVKDVIEGYVKERKLVADTEPPGGRGGSGSNGAVKFTKYSELKKSFEDQGKSTLGLEFANEIAKAQKENPEFAMDK